MQTWAWAAFIWSQVTSGDKSVCQAMSHLLNNLRQEMLDLSSKLDHSQMAELYFFFMLGKSKIKLLFLCIIKSCKNKVNMHETFPNGWHPWCLTQWSRTTLTWCICRALWGRKAFGFAPVPDNDRLAGCFLHCSRQAINLSGPASLEIPALRLRRKKKKKGGIKQPEMLLSKYFS